MTQMTIVHTTASCPRGDSRSENNPHPDATEVRVTTGVRTKSAQWLPVALNLVLLILSVTHVVIATWFLSDVLEHWASLNEHRSSWHLWHQPGHQSLARWTALVLLPGPLLWLAGRWVPSLRRLAPAVCLVGSAFAVLLPLSSPGHWELGLGLGPWTWGLPMRLAALAVAVAAILLLLRPALGWPRWLLALGLASLVLLLLVPQPAQDQLPRSLFAFCYGLGSPGACRKAPAACRGQQVLPERASVAPAKRILASIPLRAKARARVEDRLETLRQGRRPEVSHGWYGIEPFSWRIRASGNALLHLWWQEVRLLSLALLLIVGLPVAVWLAIRRTTRPPVALAAFLALLATVVATAVLPEWARMPLVTHLPTALLLPLATVSLSAVIAHLWPRPGSRRPDDPIRESPTGEGT